MFYLRTFPYSINRQILRFFLTHRIIYCIPNAHLPSLAGQTQSNHSSSTRLSIQLYVISDLLTLIIEKVDFLGFLQTNHEVPMSSFVCQLKCILGNWMQTRCWRWAEQKWRDRQTFYQVKQKSFCCGNAKRLKKTQKDELLRICSSLLIDDDLKQKLM